MYRYSKRRAFMFLNSCDFLYSQLRFDFLFIYYSFRFIKIKVYEKICFTKIYIFLCFLYKNYKFQ